VDPNQPTIVDPDGNVNNIANVKEYTDFDDNGSFFRTKSWADFTIISKAPKGTVTVPTKFEWNHGGKEVYVTGSFDQWKRGIKLQLKDMCSIVERKMGEKDEYHSVVLNLVPGTYMYKFMVDGEWKHAADKPFTQDERAFVNNVIRVINPLEPLDRNVLFAFGQLDCNILRSHFMQGGQLFLTDAIEIIDRAADLFKVEPNLLELNCVPVTICGDTHGQFRHLPTLMDVGGNIKKTTYVFLGDYVDRGHMSVELVLYLFALKIRFPKNIYMLRGNHESRSLTASFSFLEECQNKYNLRLYQAFMKAFDHMPLCARINKRFFLCSWRSKS